MKVSGSYKIDGDRERVYRLLQDPEVLARCMPGCDALVRMGPGEYSMKMKLMLASLSGLFEGKIAISDEKPPESFRMKVEGTGKIGFLKGIGNLNLVPENGATNVDYEGDVSLGGTIAAIGQRMVDTTSKMMIKRFFEKFGEIVRTEDKAGA